MPSPVRAAGTSRPPCARSLDGDFLFLDVDTLVIRPIDAIWETSADLAAVSDGNRPLGVPTHCPPGRQTECEQLGWDWPPPRYLNAGVMYWRDTPAARCFGEQWHQRRRRGWAHGYLNDQVPLNTALAADEDLAVQVLHDRYNAQIQTELNAIGGAAILHIYTKDIEHRNATLFHELVYRLHETGTIEKSLLKRVIDTGYPWRDELCFRRQFAARRYGRALIGGAYRVFEKLHQV